MGKSKVVSIVAATVLSVALGGLGLAPVSASASEPELDRNQISALLGGYASQIKDGYSGISLRTLSEDKQSQLAAENSSYKDVAQDAGMKVHDAQVSTSVVSTEQVGDGYETVVDITSNVMLVPAVGTNITIAGEHRDHLDSSFTDRHVIILGKDSSNPAPYSVVSDEIVDPLESDDGTEPEAINTPNLMPSGNMRSAPYAKDMFTNKAGLNYIRMMQYAERWTATDRMNPDFPIYKEEGHGGNCTNFLSQAVYAGGLRTTWGSSLDVKNEKVWTWNLAGIAHASHTWSGAKMNYTYMRYHSGAFTPESNPYHVGGGGLIYANFGNCPDGFNHAMVVVGNTSGAKSVPIICQKSVNRHDTLFSDSVRRAPANTSWAGLQWMAN